MTFSRVAVIVTITAVLVYLGLNVLLPHHDKEKTAGAAVSPEEVFSAPAATAETTAGTAPAPDAAAAPAAPETAATAPAEAGAAPAADTSAAGGLTEEEARKIAENVSREVATRVAESAAAPAPAPAAAEPAAPAPAPAPEVAAAPEPAAPAAEPAAGSEYESAVRASTSNLSDADVQRIATEVARKLKRGQGSSRHAVAPAADTAAAEPAAPKPKKAAAKPAPAAVAAAPANSGVATQKGSLDTISAWWPAASKVSSDRLSLVYAGEAASEKAVVLMFASDLGDAASAGSNISVLDAKGVAAGGSWSAGGNARLLVYRGVKPGRYTVILKPTLADASGKTLGSELHGPVYVH